MVQYIYILYCSFEPSAGIPKKVCSEKRGKREKNYQLAVGYFSYLRKKERKIALYFLSHLPMMTIIMAWSLSLETVFKLSVWFFEAEKNVEFIHPSCLFLLVLPWEESEVGCQSHLFWKNHNGNCLSLGWDRSCYKDTLTLCDIKHMTVWILILTYNNGLGLGVIYISWRSHTISEVW